MSSPSYSITNSNKKKTSAEDFELNIKKSISLKNRKFSFSGYSIKVKFYFIFLIYSFLIINFFLYFIKLKN